MTIPTFHWILPAWLAGSAQPGFFNPLEEDLDELREVGIRLIVSLTEEPLDPSPEAFGFEVIHFPVDDMGIPSPSTTRAMCQRVLGAIGEGKPALFHCKAGLGRTGTLLACCLVAMGRTADEAIAEIRRVNNFYIQTQAQEEFVHHFAEPRPAGRELPPLSLKAVVRS